MSLRRAIRTSMATRLLVGGLAFTLVVIMGVGGLLLVSRNQQSQAGALSNADNRASVAQQLINRVAEPQAQYAATALAGSPSIQAALAGPAPAWALTAQLGESRFIPSPGFSIVVLDRFGHVLYTDGPGPHVTASSPSVRDAMAVLARSDCAAARRGMDATVLSQCPAAIAGTELLSGVPMFDVAVPVFGNVGAAPLGIVVYSSSLAAEFSNYGPVIGYTPVFLSAGGTGSMLRFSAGSAAPAAGTAVAALVSAIHNHATTSPDDTFVAHAIYTAPGAGEVAGSFVPLSAPGGSAVAGYVGVEVPLSIFAAGTGSDERAIVELSITAMVIVALLVLLFVDRFVRRPVARLERGVARIAAGDYSTGIPVTSQDELGRLATLVNLMRERIAGYVRHVEGSSQRLQDVSRALTSTTGGVERLQDAVLDAATATVGGGNSVLFDRNGDRFAVARTHEATTPPQLDAAATLALLRGETVRSDEPDQHLLALPMFFQGEVTGALLTVTTAPVFEGDQRTLETLANNAAVATQNAMLFDQQKQAVERLRELSQMKSDFLATAQHELRTPVLTIKGQLDLLAAAWDQWDDTSRRDVIADIDIATRLLGELLETIVDFSLLSADTVELRQQPVGVAAAVDDAAAAVRGHFKAGLPVKLFTEIAPDLTVRADPARFRQVLRALLDNAVKFTPAGGTVAVRAEVDPEAACCRIDVIDTGVGISADAVARVFDRFYQEDTSRTRRFGGMGLGLSLVQRLCEAHGATVSVESTVGTGTRFTVRWPLAAEPAQPTTPFRRFRPRARVA